MTLDEYKIPLFLRFMDALLYIGLFIFKKSTFLRNAQKSNLGKIIAHLTKLSKLGPTLDVPEVHDIDRNTFFRKYLKTSTPVIFKGAARHWQCTQEWDLDFLKDNFGNEKITNIKSHGLDDTNSSSSDVNELYMEEKYVSDVVDDIKAGRGDYIRFSPFLEQRPELIKSLDNKWLKDFCNTAMNIAGIQSFIGAQNRYTPLHNASMPFMYIMVNGSKKWTIIPAHFTALFNRKNSKRVYNFINDQDVNYLSHALKYECTLEQGDILFVPSWYWHDVKNLSQSWGVSYRYSSIRSFLSTPSMVLTRIFFSEPSIFKVLFSNFLLKKKSTILTPKFFKE